MTVMGDVATLILGLLALYGIVDLIGWCFGEADMGRAEERAHEDSARRRKQAKIRMAINDAVRLDDPLVRMELHDAIREYRAG